MGDTTLRRGLRLLLVLALLLTATAVAQSSADDGPRPNASVVAAVAAQLGLKGDFAFRPLFHDGSSAVLEMSAGGSAIGCVCIEGTGGEGPLKELIWEDGAVKAFTQGAANSAQRAIGALKTLGEPSFSHDGMMSYSLCFPYFDKASGKPQGKVAVDVLAGRLSLPGKCDSGLAGSTPAPLSDAHLLDVPRLKMHMSFRATTLAMLFAYFGDHGWPQVGERTVKGAKQTEEQYIEDFSKACGACSERTATEIFITDRGMMADIGTYRVSKEHPYPDLPAKIVWEIDHDRPVYARVSAANVNHYLILCGYVKTSDGLLLISRLPAAEDAANTSGGYCAFSLPAAFDSAEFATVELRKEKK